MYCFASRIVISQTTFQNCLAKKLSEQALIRADRVEKSYKIVKRTCSSIRDLRVTKVCHESKIGLKCFPKVKIGYVYKGTTATINKC